VEGYMKNEEKEMFLKWGESNRMPGEMATEVRAPKRQKEKVERQQGQ